MAYVQISRAELEEWLDTLHLHKKWSIKQGTSGIYLLPLSDVAAVKLSSTVGSADDAMGRGQASMQLSLISLVTGQVLNKKAQGQSHFARTTNWRITWKTGIERFREAYHKSQGFYDAIAVIKDREAYKKDILSRIEALPNWQSRDILGDFHARVLQGGVLTPKQLELLDKILASPAPEPHKPPPAPPSAPQAPVVDEAFIERVRALYVHARDRGDNWLMGFAESIGKQLKAGRPLTPRQEEVLNQNLSRAKVAQTLPPRKVLRQVVRRLLVQQ